MNLIAEGELKQALDVMHDYTKEHAIKWQKDVTLLSFQYSRVEREKTLSTLSYDYIFQKESTIVTGLLSLLENMERSTMKRKTAAERSIE